MHYINPYDLLEINTDNLADVDSATINKAKRKLLAEIELSDSNTIIHGGIELNRGDCLKAIDDLDNRDKKEFHFFIYQHKHLKRFLTKGKISFFENYQAESIYKLPEFLDFISQYFAEQYDKILLENYKQWNSEVVKIILSVKPITNEAHYERCYKSTYSFVKETDNEINEITKDIKNNKSPFIAKKFKGIDTAIIEKVNVPILNLLPSYFQVLRNQLASSIRTLAIDINNDPYSLYEPAFKVIDIANNISTDALTRQKLIKDHDIIKRNYKSHLTKQQTQEKENAETQLLSWWRKKVNQIEEIKDEIEDGESKYISSDFYSLDKVVYEITDPPKLNTLPDNFQSIRNDIASTVRSLAITVNNEPHHKHKVAYDLISIAYSINADGDIAEKVSDAYTVIKRNFDKKVGQTTKTKTTDSFKETTEAKEEKKSKSDLFGIGLIVCMAVGFFYRPLQYFILGVQLLILLVTLRYSLKKYKREELNIGTLIKSSAIFIVGAIIGFFNIFVARVFVAFYFFLFSYETISPYFTAKKKVASKKNWISILFLMLALVASYLYTTSFENNIQEPKPSENSNEILPSSSSPESKPIEPTTAEIKFSNSNDVSKVKVDSINFVNSKQHITKQPKPVKKNQPTDSQYTGEIKF